MTTLHQTGRALFALAVLAMPLAAAQTMKAPGFIFSKDPTMNMMMTGGRIDLSAYPGAKLLSSKIAGNVATLVYAGNDAKGVFAFYDKAILAEGWTHGEGRMADKADDQQMMAGSSMAGDHAMNGSSMAGDQMKGEGQMMADKMNTAAEYNLNDHHLTLSVKASAGRVTVSFLSR